MNPGEKNGTADVKISVIMEKVNLDWKNLSFSYLKTDYNIRSYYRDGAWSTPEMTSDEMVSLQRHCIMVRTLLRV